jgi:hypothetical protein
VLVGQALYDLPCSTPGRQRQMDDLGLWYTAADTPSGYLRIMQLTISIPDDLYAKAGHEAKQCGLPTDELCARVLSEHFRRIDEQTVTARLDAVCRSVDDPDADEAFARRAARKTAASIDW